MTTPYSEDFEPLPMEEIGRMLRGYRGKRGFFGNENKLTLLDVSKETRILRPALRCMSEGKPFNHIKDTKFFGRKRQQKLSRWLIKAACGMIVKRDGKVVYLDEPTKPMPVVRRVKLGVTGPMLTKGEQHTPPRVMPQFMDIFKVAPTIKLPKGLR